jgi:predicted amidophosphoribosyltransferase
MTRPSPATAPTDARRCEVCNGERIAGERYCKVCRKAVIDRMKSDGYFVPTPNHISTRTAEMKELTHETKFGTGY